VVVALTFISCYHQIRRPLMATVSLLVGIAYTLGFATLTVGHLNILTITFVPILIGMAIDFGVHHVARNFDAHVLARFVDVDKFSLHSYEP
jgi:predicted RND superfamily exporter protein